MVDHQADCILPLIDQIRTLHLGKDDLIFIRVKEEAAPPDLKRISDVFNQAFPHNLVYVLDHRVDLSVVRPDSELAKRLGPYPDDDAAASCSCPCHTAVQPGLVPCPRCRDHP